MSRTLTRYERERLERLLNNWVESKQGAGAALTGYASTSAYAGQTAGRGENFETRYPILQQQADQVDAVVYGRAATQLLPAVAPMCNAWREPLEFYYLRMWRQDEIARRLKIARRTVNDRLHAARLAIWDGVNQKCDSATTRASA